MSRENVEAIRRALEDANAGVFGPRFDALFGPHVEFRDELGTLDTREDLRAYLESFRETSVGFTLKSKKSATLATSSCS
jgi:hypothetical protein